MLMIDIISIEYDMLIFFANLFNIFLSEVFLMQVSDVKISLFTKTISYHSDAKAKSYSLILNKYQVFYLIQ